MGTDQVTTSRDSHVQRGLPITIRIFMLEDQCTEVHVELAEGNISEPSATSILVHTQYSLRLIRSYLERYVDDAIICSVVRRPRVEDVR